MKFMATRVRFLQAWTNWIFLQHVLFDMWHVRQHVCTSMWRSASSPFPHGKYGERERANERDRGCGREGEMYIHLMYTHIYICMCVLELQASASLQISTNKDASLQINTVNTATDVYICAQITGPHSLSHATCAVTCISIFPPTCSPFPHCLCHVANITSILDKTPTLVHSADRTGVRT